MEGVVPGGLALLLMGPLAVVLPRMLLVVVAADEDEDGDDVARGLAALLVLWARATAGGAGESLVEGEMEKAAVGRSRSDPNDSARAGAVMGGGGGRVCHAAPPWLPLMGPPRALRGTGGLKRGGGKMGCAGRRPVALGPPMPTTTF